MLVIMPQKQQQKKFPILSFEISAILLKTSNGNVLAKLL